jgi:hypothetical protein
MATSEYIPKSQPSERPPKQFGYQPAKSRRLLAGPGFASKLLRMSGDVIIVVLAFALALEVKLHFFDDGGTFKTIHSALYLGFFAWFLCCLLLVSEHYDLYNPILVAGGARELRPDCSSLLERRIIAVWRPLYGTP